MKKDVEYLDAGARARIAEEALGIKLATYKYKTGSDREHLGFILEDSPNVPAADMTSKQVDLYAYTSMVLATVQEQEKKSRRSRPRSRVSRSSCSEARVVTAERAPQVA